MTAKLNVEVLSKQRIFHYIDVYYNRIRRDSVLGFIALDGFEQQFKVASVKIHLE